MEARFTSSLVISTCIDLEKTSWKSRNGFLTIWDGGKHHRVQMLTMRQLQRKKSASFHGMDISCSFQKTTAGSESQTFKSPLENASCLKNKSQEVLPYLNGRCIYLVGMMGCGKTTVGKSLSEVLDYSFVDSDVLVEQTMGEMSTAEIFKLHGEPVFRDKESEVLSELSRSHHLVVSTGGGAVIRPINWKHMHKGISVWLDVPLKALAQRIAAVGTSSRPLLQIESGDVLEKTYRRLSILWEERREAYANANAMVSLECVAANLGRGDVANLTPADIAIEVLKQIEGYLRKEGEMLEC